MTIPQAFALAVQHHQAGRLAEAEALYRQILAVEPHHAEALHFLGVIAHQVGRHALAVDLIQRALTLRPDNAAAHSNLGEAYRALGHFDEAIASFQCGLRLRPDDAKAQNNLSAALMDQGRIDEAERASRRALELEPRLPEAHNNLGNALAEQGRRDEAVAALRRALELRPDYPEAQSNLGAVLKEAGEFDEAVAVYRAALAFHPNFAEAHNNLANALKDGGELEEALVHYRRALELDPENARVHSNLIYGLHYQPGLDDGRIADEQGRWNRKFYEPLKRSILPPTNDRDPKRRLRIGYVSQDFRRHSVAFFLVPLFEAHDHREFEIYCYARVLQPDEMTERLRKSADVWRDMRGHSDAQIAERVRADGIDILVDLAMHTEGNLLQVFARRPAPVQVTWLAYAGSAGMEAIDYRLTDAHIDPVDQKDTGFGGEAVRLPDSWCCYAPIQEFPPVSPLPAAQKGTMTFGSLNQFGKIHEGLLRCWARLLEAVPDSRLLMLCRKGKAEEQIHAFFAGHGIARGRVECVFFGAWPDYTRLFERLDLALDSYPYNGMTTTCHTLWMGVPLVTLSGSSALSRAGSSLLHTVGLPEWVARSEEEYIRIAIEWATDLPRLTELRAALRPRMEASALMDAPRFARHVEAAFRTMWQRWCAAKNPSPPS